jgi:ABC-type transporter Mla MlaB component
MYGASLRRGWDHHTNSLHARWTECHQNCASIVCSIDLSWSQVKQRDSQSIALLFSYCTHQLDENRLIFSIPPNH